MERIFTDLENIFIAFKIKEERTLKEQMVYDFHLRDKILRPSQTGETVRYFILVGNKTQKH